MQLHVVYSVNVLLVVTAFSCAVFPMFLQMIVGLVNNTKFGGRVPNESLLKLKKVCGLKCYYV